MTETATAGAEPADNLDSMEALKRRLALFIKSYEAKFVEQQSKISELEQDNSNLKQQVDKLTS